MGRVPMIVLVCCGALAAFAPSAQATAVATTGTATNVTATTAVLQGTVNAPSADSVYAFRYGKTTAYGSVSRPKVAGTGTLQVSATVTNLKANTSYHFQLVVADASTDPTRFFAGADVTFTTTGTVAVTGNATSVTSSSAVVHGLANPAGSAYWAFQYGTTGNYGRQTTVRRIGRGVSALGVTLRGLRAGTTYHFRLVVVQPSSSAPYYDLAVGADHTFRTRAGRFGTTRLVSPRLRVSNGVVAIKLRCVGAAGASCRGRISLRASGAGAGTDCGTGSFSASSGHARIIRANVGTRCAALLAAAPGRQLAATLKGSFSSNQPALRRSVTMLG